MQHGIVIFLFEKIRTFYLKNSLYICSIIYEKHVKRHQTF
ncbi:MAG: hypothetical protein RLZZ292_2621 [Bacteroidota bacterium]|jgi:hypothetical protein